MFGPCVRAYQNICRSLLIVDGTHLLGKYPGSLFVACALYNNNKLLSVAYTVVEMTSTWKWFLSLVCDHVLTHPSESEYHLMTILSNKRKGLLLVVKDVLSKTRHAFCMKHMKANLKLFLKDAYMHLNFRKAT